MSIKEFVQELRDKTKTTELSTMYKRPVREKKSQMPTTQTYDKDTYHQADLLYLPQDKGINYLLVVVDVGTGYVDAEPLKKRDAKTVSEAFKTIYSRQYLDLPIIITLDQGTEFKGETKAYLERNKVNVKYALTGRHRQLAIVERMNQTIGTIFLKRQASQELLTGETSSEWVEDLKPLIAFLNEKRRRPKKIIKDPEPIADEYTGKLLTLKQRVRILLDYPINNTNNQRLHGTFRSGDVRWSPDIHKISEVLLKPGFPPMYLTDNDDLVARTKNQLQVVYGDEPAPNPKYIRGKPENYIISRIIDMKKVGRKTEYLVMWKGFTKEHNSWVGSEQFSRTKVLKDMLKDFLARRDA